MEYLILILAWLALILIYALLHELIHYVMALIFKCRARIAIISDSVIVPSLSVVIDHCRVNRLSKILILYSPYTLNLILLILGVKLVEYVNIIHGMMLVFVAILTLPNLVLEDQAVRVRIHNLLRKCLMGLSVSN